MIVARAHSLIPFFVVYMQEVLILASPMAIDMILPHSWDSICEDELSYTEELDMVFASQKPKVAERLRRAGERRNVGIITP